jgi:hypothetical protein
MLFDVPALIRLRLGGHDALLTRRPAAHRQPRRQRRALEAVV